MYVVMGVTGHWWCDGSRSLLAARQPVRAVVRSAQDAARWARQGCETAIADLNPAARDKGVVPSFLQPLDRRIPMVATEDVGRVAAELLLENWNGKRIVELEEPRRLSPNDIARV